MNNTEIIAFLQRCDNEFQKLPCPKQYADCQICFNECYYGTGQDSYSCGKGCFYYAMHYAPAYISEVYHFLTISKILEQVGNPNVVIYSLGGGMGTDFCAVRQYIESNSLNNHGTYTLFDKEQQWQAVINQYAPQLVISISDLTQTEVNFGDADIVFVNK